MLEHGGRLRRAAQQYGIPESDWLDLSTGINPDGWPVPPIPPQAWQRLPQDDDELNAAAQSYYGTSELLAVAGSQAAIQALPTLRPRSRVVLAAHAYAEHAQAWRRHGHEVVAVPEDEILQQGASAEVVLIINPNNPTGKMFAREELLSLHAQLAARGGWLVVDEAFMDTTPEHSLAGLCPCPGLIVLRSLGKFFGLAGARVGFVLAGQALLKELNELLGPWTIAAPSRLAATLAMRDAEWQRGTRAALPQASQRLAQLLSTHGFEPTGGCALFQWIRRDDAQVLHERLARHGILTRRYDAPSSLRFGLPGSETEWKRLGAALQECAA